MPGLEDGERLELLLSAQFARRIDDAIASIPNFQGKGREMFLLYSAEYCLYLMENNEARPSDDEEWPPWMS